LRWARRADCSKRAVPAALEAHIITIEVWLADG
jgi:hypothetical protein